MTANSPARPTKGPWLVGDPTRGDTDEMRRMVYADDTLGNRIADCSRNPHIPLAEQLANAALIAEAGTVYDETGFTPRQLADQRKDLLAAVEEALSVLANIKTDMQHKVSPKATIEAINRSIPGIRAALRRARGEG